MSAVKLFLSWAHADHALKEDLVSRLTPHLKSVKKYDFTWRENSLIISGEEWEEEIYSRFEEDDYIVQLMLKDAPLNGDYESHYINGWQIRRTDQRAYGDFRENVQRDRFVNEFTDAIIRRADNRGEYR